MDINEEDDMPLPGNTPVPAPKPPTAAPTMVAGQLARQSLGNLNRWVTLNRTWSDAEGFSVTTDAMEVDQGDGCIVRSTIVVNGLPSVSICYVPNTRLSFEDSDRPDLGFKIVAAGSITNPNVAGL